MYISDISHFIDESGHIADMATKARRRAESLTGLIEIATEQFPVYQFVTDVSCKNQRCKGVIDVTLERRDEPIFWVCPVCRDAGTINNWQGTKWDHINSSQRPAWSLDKKRKQP